MSESHKHIDDSQEMAGPSPDGTSYVLTLRIEKMDCPTEESLIRNKLEGMDGVDSLDFNLIQRKLTVKHKLQDVESIITAIKALDMEPVLENVPKPSSDASQAVFIIDNMDCPT
ncbi:MAG: heavy metal-associated domain-containing protein, partial [Nitrosomonadales bacterium]|nr:heavy metal-associated domain-containing protein [Nitrosomonadales bacterium]